jgi:hypothetical protein
MIKELVKMDDSEKLVQLQKMIVDLLAEQEKIAVQLAELRNQGKGKTVQFRQLFVKKLSNINVISLLQSYELM